MLAMDDSATVLVGSVIPKRILFLVATSLVCPAIVGAQGRTIPLPVPQVLNRGLGMIITPYTDRPADITLVPHGQDARHGHIWLQNVGDGLLVVGEVDGDPPDFPRNQNLILDRDHVEIWLADAQEPELPPMGWENRVEEDEFLPNGADSCADWAKKSLAENKQAMEKKCRRWADMETHYRPYFKRLFLRQYLVTPDYAVESFAAPAYHEITTRFASDQPGRGEEVPALLEPRTHVQMWAGPGINRVGYTFEIMVPFTDFPPLSTTELGGLRLLVDVFNAPEPGTKVGAYSSSSPSRRYGIPGSFNLVSFDPPHQFHLSPCNFSLAGKSQDGNHQEAWFVPNTVQDWEFDSEAFSIANGGGGYPDGPEGLSPVAHPTHYFWHGVSENEWVCGPHLSYRKGGEIARFDQHVDAGGFDTRRLPQGELLIKVGPRSYGVESSGQCGACPRTELRILRLNKDLKIREVLSLSGVVDTGIGASQDFTVSSDWSEVVEYDRAASDEPGKQQNWSSTSWCLREPEYEECGHKDNVEPPDPPILKELRNDD
jgi:hypothetical protein